MISSTSDGKRRPVIAIPNVIGLLEKLANSLGRLIFPFCNATAFLGAMLIVIMSFLIVVDILLRFFFRKAIVGMIEFEAFMLATVVFLSIAYTMTLKGHISMNLFSEKFSKQTKAITESVGSALGIFFFTIICWQYIIRTEYSIGIGEVGQVSNWPYYPFLILVALGSGMITLVIVINFFRSQAEILKNFSRPWPWILLAGFLAALVMASPWALQTLSVKLARIQTGALGIGFLMVLMFLGFPIGFSMGIVGVLGTWYLQGFTTSMGVVKMVAFETAADYFFCVIPFFILMGFICFRSGISRSLYDTAYKFMGHFRGGLAMASVAGCGGFAAICGDSMATAVTMGTVALPEMRNHNYNCSLATGCLAAGGTLGILIPPSIGFIVYGIITEESIGKLFMAGILPGILLTSAFIATIAIQCKINPTLGPAGEKSTLKEKMLSLKGIAPVLALFLLIMGGLYLGFFTATEGGAVGAVGALIYAVFSGNFSWRALIEVTLETAQFCGMIFTMLIGVTLLGFFMALTEIPNALSSFIVSLQVSRYCIFLFICILYIILGCLFNIIPMIMLTLPIIYPSVVALGFDPIWFGVIMVVLMEMGQISPPVGINVFVIYGVAKDVPMYTIFKGIFPFLIAEGIVIIILILFPQIALWLPNAMKGLASIPG